MKRFTGQLFQEDLLNSAMRTDCVRKRCRLYVINMPPNQQIRKRAYSYPWITADVKQLIFNRDKKKRKAIFTKQNVDWSILLYDMLKPNTTVIK